VRRGAYSKSVGKPRVDKDAAQDLALGLADIAGQLASLKGEADAWLRDSNYAMLKLRAESAHSAVEGKGCSVVEARQRARLVPEPFPAPVLPLSQNRF
jgi:hypothetical protein